MVRVNARDVGAGLPRPLLGGKMFIQYDRLDKYGNTIHRYRDERDFETREDAMNALMEQGYHQAFSGWWTKSDHRGVIRYMARIFG